MTYDISEGADIEILSRMETSAQQIQLKVHT